MHLYLVFHCKTDGCLGKHPVKYLGETGYVQQGVDVSVPAPFVLECPQCENPYNYRLDDLEEFEWSQPPPVDFRDRI